LAAQAVPPSAKNTAMLIMTFVYVMRLRKAFIAILPLFQ
jgi:hypothetical protein